MVRRLGKGLQALIPTSDLELLPEGNQPHLRVELLDSNPFQPRQDFGEDEMVELVNSIKAKGVLQPLTVRETADGRYQLIAGERRLRAAKILGLETVPVYILGVDTDVEMMEFALIENIQRQDLNPIEQAEAFALLSGKYNLTQEEISQQVGMSRPAVANILRLLKLPVEIKESLRKGDISMGHARAMLGLPQAALMQALWKRIINDGLSVRQTEATVQVILERTASPSSEKEPKKHQKPVTRSPYLRQVEEELVTQLVTKVKVKSRKGDSGTIEISYYSLDDLQRLLDLIIGED